LDRGEGFDTKAMRTLMNVARKGKGGGKKKNETGRRRGVERTEQYIPRQRLGNLRGGRDGSIRTWKV